MPLQPGETTLTTLFCDVHLLFSPPGQRPAHDRFEKASYFYLHHNPATGAGRIEVANNPGRPEQDAFEGYLHNVHVTYSHKRPSAVVLTVLQPDGDGDQTWRVRNLDPTQQRQYLYPLQRADVYFWTRNDATDFVEGLKHISQVGRLDIQDAPASQRQSGAGDSMSSVVQKLEQAAIHPGGPYNQRRTASTSTAQSLPPPPPGQPPASASPALQDPAAYQPVPAYNPAAPAAPEPIAHREKTPPPVDADTGTGLHQATLVDRSGGGAAAAAGGIGGGYSPFGGSVGSNAPQAYSKPFSPAPSHLSHSVSPQQPHGMSFAPPPPQAAAGQPSYSPAPAYTSQPGSPAFVPPYVQAFPGPSPQSPGFASHRGISSPQASFSSPPPQSPGYPPHFQQQQQQQQQQQTAQPPSNSPYPGYSQFDYSQNQGMSPAAAHQIHQSVYIPTEIEAGHGKKAPQPPTPGQAGPGQKAGRVDGKLDKVDKSVNKFLKKWDKRLG